MKTTDLNSFILHLIEEEVASAKNQTQYRRPLLAFAAADNPLFEQLKKFVEKSHMLPDDLLPGARSVVAYFLPFDKLTVEANRRPKAAISVAWCKAYIETNQLIGQISAKLIAALVEKGIRAAAEPATHNFDPKTLVSHWSHKSVAVIAGLGSFGLNQLVITDSGCAGRFGSLVIDADLAISPIIQKERCLHYYDQSCDECLQLCPVRAISKEKNLNKQLCWKLCLSNARAFEKFSGGWADVCGDCATGPCALKSAV